MLGEISRFCEKAAVIKDGHIIACDTVENFSKAGYKIIRLADVKNMQAVCSIDDVFNPYAEGNNLTFSYRGDIKNLLGELSKAEFKDILISDPDFEESVIHYYTREGVK